MPEMTEQRRKELVKVAHKYAEDARVAVRHVRRDGIDVIKKLEKDHAIPEDDAKRDHDQVQKATDQFVHESTDPRREGERDHAGLSGRGGGGIGWPGRDNNGRRGDGPPPRHVAIIMDGNGRWARSRGLPRLEGHRRGVEAVRARCAPAIDLGVEI